MNDTDSPSPSDQLTRAVDRLVGQVAHWQPARWSGTGVEPSRADRVHALVQRLADLGADAERRPRAPVPRLGDLVLPDQLRVLANDLLANDLLADGRLANDPLAAARSAAASSTHEDPGAASRAISAAAEDVDAVRRSL